MPPSTTEFYAYILADPATGVAFYVGKGHGHRVARHLDGNSHAKKVHAHINALSVAPLIIKVPAVDEAHAFELERSLILALGRIDRGTGTLLNRTSGGQGSAGRTFKHSEETKAKIGASIKGKVRSEETRTRMRASAQKRFEDPAVRAQLAQANRGRPVSEATRAKMSATMKRVIPREHLARMTRAAADKARKKRDG